MLGNRIKAGLVNRGDWDRKLTRAEIEDSCKAQPGADPRKVRAVVLEAQETICWPEDGTTSMQDVFDIAARNSDDSEFDQAATAVLVAMREHFNTLAGSILPRPRAVLADAPRTNPL
jgi:hypothetical protein